MVPAYNCTCSQKRTLSLNDLQFQLLEATNMIVPSFASNIEKSFKDPRLGFWIEDPVIFVREWLGYPISQHMHRIHVWYIWLHLVDLYGKFTTHGSYGMAFHLPLWPYDTYSCLVLPFTITFLPLFILSKKHGRRMAKGLVIRDCFSHLRAFLGSDKGTRK